MKAPLDNSQVVSAGVNAGASAQAPQAPGAATPSPRTVIRGTSEKGGEQRTKVDYLSISCEEDGRAISDCLDVVFGDAPVRPVYEHGPGMRHFAKSRRVVIAGMPVGVVLTGGETQRGKACVDISGVGCGFVTDWGKAEGTLLGLPGRSWRRADIAADFFRDELTHERVLQAHADGKFVRGGRAPVLTELRTTDRNRGRTIYVGQRGGDAMGRFYEKGKKEFAGSGYHLMRRFSPFPEHVSVRDDRLNGGETFNLAAWYRAELELRAKNRPVPDEWITQRDAYFAGAYPFLAELLPEVEPRAIVRPRDRGILAIEKALDRVKKQWGAVLYTGLAFHGGDYVALCGKIVGDKHSQSLIEAGALLALGDEQ